MNSWEAFTWGVLGSVAVELVTLLSLYGSASRRLPPRYRKVGFWVTRSVLAVLAGLLVVAYEIDKRIAAFNVGAATPLIVTFMAQGFRRTYSPPTMGSPHDEAPGDSAPLAKTEKPPARAS